MTPGNGVLGLAALGALAVFVRQAGILAELRRFLVPCYGQADWLPPDTYATLAARHGEHGADGQAPIARPGMAEVEVIRFTCRRGAPVADGPAPTPTVRSRLGGRTRFPSSWQRS